MEVKKLNKSMIFIIIAVLIVIYGCAPASETITFKEGVERINDLDEKFDASMKIPPNSTEKIDGLLAELTGFSAVNQDMPTSLKYLLDFKIKMLEAEKLHTEGWQWGKGSTTDYGFGCKKGYERITNSSNLRIASAQKGYEALNALESLINEFPEEAESLDLTQKDVLFFNAAYYQIEEKARRDASIVYNLCIKNKSEELNATGG